MKKLLVLAALSAMAMGAKAYYTTELDIYGYYTDGVSVETRQSYQTAYVVLSSALVGWDGTVGGLSGISKLAQLSGSYESGRSYFSTTSYDQSDYEKITGAGKNKGDFAAIIVSESLNDAFAAECTNAIFDEYEMMLEKYGDAILTFKNQSSPYGGPTPAPEPTSGLLLLLGIAGLALKRKRA